MIILDEEMNTLSKLLTMKYLIKIIALKKTSITNPLYEVTFLHPQRKKCAMRVKPPPTFITINVNMIFL